MKIESGDIITCKGVSAVVDRVVYEEHFPATQFCPEWWVVEFYDKNGVFRNWNMQRDGGSVSRHER